MADSSIKVMRTTEAIRPTMISARGVPTYPDNKSVTVALPSTALSLAVLDCLDGRYFMADEERWQAPEPAVGTATAMDELIRKVVRSLRFVGPTVNRLAQQP